MESTVETAHCVYLYVWGGLSVPASRSKLLAAWSECQLKSGSAGALRLREECNGAVGLAALVYVGLTGSKSVGERKELDGYAASMLMSATFETLGEPKMLTAFTGVGATANTRGGGVPTGRAARDIWSRLQHAARWANQRVAALGVARGGAGVC